MNPTGMTAYEACLIHAKTERNLRQLIAAELEEYQLTKNEWLLLATIAKSSAHGYGIGDFATLLDVGMPHVTMLVKGLTEKKLVRQKKDESDRRRRDLVVTKKAESLIVDTEARIKEALKTYLSDVPREKLDTYYEVLTLLANRT